MGARITRLGNVNGPIVAGPGVKHGHALSGWPVLRHDFFQFGQAPAFSAAFMPGTRFVAIADEEGFVTLMDTSTGKHGVVRGSQFFCHANAICKVELA